MKKDPIDAIIAKKYVDENINPIIKGIIQAGITFIDLLIMFVIIWNVFIYFIPAGSL